MPVCSVTVSPDVSAVAPRGCRNLAADVCWDPASVTPTSPVVVCLPGGGMSRRYFDLAAKGYSMAAHLAAAGYLVIVLDHPGVGESDVPEDPWLLTPDVVASVDAEAVRETLRLIGEGVEGAPKLDPANPPKLVGVGHSAGAHVLLHMQARERLFDAVALLGWGGHGLPEHLDEEDLRLARGPQDPPLEAAELVALTRKRHTDPLVVLRRGSSTLLNPNGIAEDAHAALVAARTPLLALVGTASILPGSSAAVAAQIDVPVFLAVGDRDIAREPHEATVGFPACHDMTVFVLENAGHNHNVEPGRAILWDRLAAWMRPSL